MPRLFTIFYTFNAVLLLPYLGRVVCSCNVLRVVGCCVRSARRARRSARSCARSDVASESASTAAAAAGAAADRRTGGGSGWLIERADVTRCCNNVKPV